MSERWPVPPGRVRRPKADKPADPSGAFPVKFRLKGEADGPVYSGQAVVIPCRTCGGPVPRKQGN